MNTRVEIRKKNIYDCIQWLEIRMSSVRMHTDYPIRVHLQDIRSTSC